MLSTPLPTTVCVVRHAEVYNPRDIVYGRLPRFGLSERGRHQAEAAARFLDARPVSALYTSPLLRARQTARILTQYHSTVVPRVARALIEVRTGFQGSPNTILKPGFSFYEPRQHPDDETMQDVFDRMLRFLQRVARRHSGGTVVAVSHADPIAILRVGLEGRALTAANLHSTVYPERASITQITVGVGEELNLTYFDVARR
ncbi:MAG: histidine phosphatase family protein [Chloroflexi bacterium]|nr:histidine phosphatase family protein [Chloroflexota bacterium]